MSTLRQLNLKGFRSMALMVLSGLLVTTGPVRAQSVCQGTGTAAPISLLELWDEIRDREPGYVAASARIAAAGHERSGVSREWAPGFSIETRGDYGQRTSPGEERVLGVGPRGEFRLLGEWTFLDSSRRWRSLEAELLSAAAEEAARGFDATYRSHAARVYLDAALGAATRELHEERHEILDQLFETVRLRMEAGVDVEWERFLVEEAIARVERLRAEAERDLAGANAELSLLVDRCVTAIPFESTAIDPSVPVASDRSEPDLATRNPELRRLEHEAGAHEALARMEANRDRWALRVIGTAGPTRSRAFDPGPVENEYLLGISAEWTPDLLGVRGQSEAAELARARALRADAEGYRLGLERELTRLEVELGYVHEERERIRHERDRAEARLDAALLRWREGVDRWTEVMQALVRAEETALLEIEWIRGTALALIRYHEGHGDLAGLPARLGQGEGVR